MKKAWIYRKIILGILSVAFSLVTLTTTTFAWFTLTTRATADNFDFSVTLGNELEISLDGITVSINLVNISINKIVIALKSILTTTKNIIVSLKDCILTSKDRV